MARLTVEKGVLTAAKLIGRLRAMEPSFPPRAARGRRTRRGQSEISTDSTPHTKESDDGQNAGPNESECAVSTSPAMVP